jgi:hypothetical protein
MNNQEQQPQGTLTVQESLNTVIALNEVKPPPQTNPKQEALTWPYIILECAKSTSRTPSFKDPRDCLRSWNHFRPAIVKAIEEEPSLRKEFLKILRTDLKKNGCLDENMLFHPEYFIKYGPFILSKWRCN